MENTHSYVTRRRKRGAATGKGKQKNSAQLNRPSTSSEVSTRTTRSKRNTPGSSRNGHENNNKLKKARTEARQEIEKSKSSDDSTEERPVADETTNDETAVDENLQDDRVPTGQDSMMPQRGKMDDINTGTLYEEIEEDESNNDSMAPSTAGSTRPRQNVANESLNLNDARNENEEQNREDVIQPNVISNHRPKYKPYYE